MSSPQKDRHTKFGRSAGVATDFDRSLNRQQDKKLVRKGDWANTNPNDDILALEDQKQDQERYGKEDAENEVQSTSAPTNDIKEQEKHQEKPNSSDFPPL